MFPLKNTEAYIHANGFRSTLGKELADRDVEINELGSEIQALTNYVAENNVKNFLPNTNTTKIINEVTFTVNSDGSITANGTATALCDYIVGKVTGLSNVVLNGCPTGGSSSTYNMQLYDETTSSWGSSDYGSGVSVTLDPSHVYQVHIAIRANQTANNLVFKPMIRDASITDPTYQPYAKTNVELTQDVAVKKLTGYTPTAGTNVSIRGIDIYRSGNTISLLVYIDVTSDLANNAVVVSFDKSLPKPATLYALGMCKSLGGDIGQLQMPRNSSNQIQAWGALKAGSYYCAPITYLTTE